MYVLYVYVTINKIIFIILFIFYLEYIKQVALETILSLREPSLTKRLVTLTYQHPA